MYRLERVETNNMLKRMHRFFKGLSNTDNMPNIQEYKSMMNKGEAWVILDKQDKVKGGLLQYSTGEYNAIINYYIPEDTRAKGISWKVYDKVVSFKKMYPNHKTFATSNDISEWKQFAKHIHGNLYEVLIPLR